MENTYSVLVNRFFSRNTFRDLLKYGDCDTYRAIIGNYIADPDKLTNKECIEKIYHFLETNYRNEYYYKNTILNKLLLGIHSPRTTTALTEVPVGKSIVDFVLINGEATAYEIKTDLDNLDRLQGQITDYYKVFPKVIVVTSEHNYLETARRIAETPTGIFVLTKRGSLSLRKSPEKNMENLSKTAMFKVLRKKEYEEILLSCFGALPKVSQFDYYRTCQAMFESVSTEDAYTAFIRALKKRRKVEIEEFRKVPYTLRFLVYFSYFGTADYQELTRFLEA